MKSLYQFILITLIILKNFNFNFNYIIIIYIKYTCVYKIIKFYLSYYVFCRQTKV